MRIKCLNRGVTTAAVALAVLLLSAPLQARQLLAPNAEGYQFIDSAERFGPEYDKDLDISASGTRLNLIDDSSSAPIYLGFRFHFYGVDYSSIRISDNGYISFDNSDNNFNPDGLEIPQPATAHGWQTPPFIAPWFDDLDPQGGGAIYYQVLGLAPSRRMVVQWSAVHHDDTLDANGGRPLIEFQAILYESTNKILFQYRHTATNSSALSHGSSATVGIQGSDTVGISYSASQPVLTDGLAIGFIPAKYGYVGIPAAQQQASGVPGDVVPYTVEVVNGKDVATDFKVELLPGSRWQVVEAPTSTGTLAPGDSTTLIIKVKVPDAGAAAMADDIISFKVTDKVAESTTSSGDGNSSSTTTQNNQQLNGSESTTVKEIMSVFNLTSRCSAAPCFQQDGDGDGVPDASEAASSVNDASKLDGLEVLSGDLMNIQVTGGALHGFTVEEAVNGPENVEFAAGVFNYRVIPARIADSVVVRITPATAWSDRLVLYKVDSDGVYTKVDAEKWTRVKNSNAIELTLVDGGEFDEDGVANGVIVDPLAIGLTVDPKANNTGDGFGSGGALGDELLLLTLLAGMRYRARRSKHPH